MTGPRLSVILPWYRKAAEFRRVLPMNAPAWRRPDLEVVLVLDEPSEEAEVLELLAGQPGIRWKVLVNDTPHPWRPPSRAINVGIRQSAGRFILVASPESAYLSDVPAQVLGILEAVPEAVLVGRVGFVTLQELDGSPDLGALFQARAPSLTSAQTYYGSIALARAAAAGIGGYDESFASWGGDDDNFRVRLELAGHPLLSCPDLHLLHVSLEDRTAPRHPQFSYDPELRRQRASPAAARIGDGDTWGRAFGRVALDLAAPSPAEGQAPPVLGRKEALAGVMISVSQRACGSCGRKLYHEPGKRPCPACAGPVSLPPQVQGLLAERGRGLKLVAVMQVRNEALYLQGCLDHLRPFVDGFVVLDDGSTDGTLELLQREPRMLDLIRNAPVTPHAWDEPGNRRRVLESAAAQGADWVLCCDADERYETAFLRRLRNLAAAYPAGGKVCVSVVFRELWNSPVRFRIDGIWGSKRRNRFFGLPREIRFDASKAFHGEWFPDQVRVAGKVVADPGHLYHLKSIRRSDRVRRRDFYQALDPDSRFQAEGYAYLAEEGPELQTVSIAEGREYDPDSLPDGF